MDNGLLDTVFSTFSGLSVALGIQRGNWRTTIGHNQDCESLILRHLNRCIHKRLQDLGDIIFVQDHVGRFRSALLERMDLESYLPSNMIEAISISELLFASDYLTLDPDTVTIFPHWIDQPMVEWKFGKCRMKFANERIIKWKTHWLPAMV